MTMKVLLSKYSVFAEPRLGQAKLLEGGSDLRRLEKKAAARAAKLAVPVVIRDSRNREVKRFSA